MNIHQKRKNKIENEFKAGVRGMNRSSSDKGIAINNVFLIYNKMQCIKSLQGNEQTQYANIRRPPKIKFIYS